MLIPKSFDPDLPGRYPNPSRPRRVYKRIYKKRRKNL